MVDDQDDSEVLPSFTTPKGNVFSIVSVRQYGFFAVKNSKGEPPDELKGDYTSLGTASTAIQNYINKMEPVRAGGSKVFKEPPKLELKDPDVKEDIQRVRKSKATKEREASERGKNLSS